MNKIEQAYQDFWKDIVENEDGTLNIEQLKKELYDYYFILEQVPIVYEEITNGKMSKPNYYAKEVITQFEDCINEEYILKDDLRSILDLLNEEAYSHVGELKHDIEELLK